MKRLANTIVFGLLCCLCSEAQVKLPQLIKDSMVLQRDSKIKIWGWASPNEKINISFNRKKFSAKADASGNWSLLLPPMKAGGPYTMNIDASNHLTLNNILIGDVWLCSGQSNMVHQMSLHSVLYANEISNANYPEIRQFLVPSVTNLQAPQKDFSYAQWKSANPTDVLQFSAVAYFFAKKLYDKYHVPIGLINASWGGTPIEAWISEDGFKEFPSILSTLEKNKDTAYVNEANRNVKTKVATLSEDKGLEGSVKWFDPAYEPKGWRTINVPGYWEDQGMKNLDGVVWYRKEINVPASMTGKPAKVFLGRIVDADVLYINGKQIGSTSYMYPQRRYAVPADVLKPGKNLFVIKVTNNSDKGGFVPDKPYQLIADNDTVDLKGYWQYKVGQVFLPTKGLGGGIALHYQPAALFNAMIAPAVGYSIKGFVWYQGEANSGNAAQYAKLLPAMINDWRTRWNSANAPFLYVQLPGFMEMNYLPSESQWAAFRDMQRRALSIPNTAMAVTIDLGEWNDIHPDRKKEVGDRLALAAEKIAYGENVVYSGPLYRSSRVDDNKMIISFTNIGSGLISNDGEALQEFAIAGADKKFVWANAKIEGDKIIVWSDDVKEPKFVRYAWADDPVNPNLYNKEGLPASPFEAEASQN
jgi:sialate O-acetylesterase